MSPPLVPADRATCTGNAGDIRENLFCKALMVHDPRIRLDSYEHVPTEIQLFQFSAAGWLSNRLHYDQAFALQTGLTALVVHSPLLGAFLCDLVDDWAEKDDGRIVEVDYRNREVAYVGDRLMAQAHGVVVDRGLRHERLRFDCSLIRSGDDVIVCEGSIGVNVRA
jgi:acyl dehydratase